MFMKKYNLIILCLLVFSIFSTAVFAQEDEDKITSLADADEGGVFSGFKMLFTRFVAFLKDEEYQPGVEEKKITLVNSKMDDAFADEKTATEEAYGEEPQQEASIAAPLSRSRGRQAPAAAVPSAVSKQVRGRSAASSPESFDDYINNYPADDYPTEEYPQEEYFGNEFSEENSYDDGNYDESYYEEEFSEVVDESLFDEQGEERTSEELPVAAEQPRQAGRGRRAPVVQAGVNAVQPVEQKRGFFGRLAQLVKRDSDESGDVLLEQRERCKELYDSGDKEAFMKECKLFMEQMREGFDDIMPAVDPERLEKCKEIAASGDRELFKAECPELFDRFAVFNNEEGRGIPEHAQFCKRLMDNGQYDRFKEECPEFVDKLAVVNVESSPEREKCKKLYDSGDREAFKEKCSQYVDRVRKEEAMFQQQKRERPSSEEEKAKCRKIYESEDKETFRKECGRFLRELEPRPPKPVDEEREQYDAGEEKEREMQEQGSGREDFSEEDKREEGMN